METTREDGRSLVNCETEFPTVTSLECITGLWRYRCPQSSGMTQGSWVTRYAEQMLPVALSPHARGCKGPRSSHRNVKLQSQTSPLHITESQR